MCVPRLPSPALITTLQLLDRPAHLLAVYCSHDQLQQVCSYPCVCSTHVVFPARETSSQYQSLWTCGVTHSRDSFEHVTTLVRPLPISRESLLLNSSPQIALRTSGLTTERRAPTWGQALTMNQSSNAYGAKNDVSKPVRNLLFQPDSHKFLASHLRRRKQRNWAVHSLKCLKPFRVSYNLNHIY